MSQLYLYDEVIAAAAMGGGATLSVTIAVGLVGVAVQERRTYGTRICRLHRTFFVDDDRFPMPCAKWGGHEPQQTGV